jgi:hypothetical protein
LSIFDFDQALEKIIPEDLLSEPPEADNPIICPEVLDDGVLLRDPARPEITRAVSRASSALEGGLAREDADPSHPAPMDMAKGSSALEVAAAENLALEGVGTGFPSTASMDVHVGSPPDQAEEAAVTHLSAALAGLVTLEVSDPNTRSLSPADEDEVPLSRAFDIVPADIPSLNNVSTLLALSLPLFLSNLQVNQLPFFTIHASKLVFFAYLFIIIGCSWFCVCPTEVLWGSCP